jgi:hypothetical protein
VFPLSHDRLTRAQAVQRHKEACDPGKTTAGFLGTFGHWAPWASRRAGVNKIMARDVVRMVLHPEGTGASVDHSTD